MTTNWRALKSWDVLSLQVWRQPTCTAIPLRRTSNIRPRYDGIMEITERTNKSKTKQILKSFLSLSLSLSLLFVCVSAGFGGVVVPYTAGLRPHTQKLESLKFKPLAYMCLSRAHHFFFPIEISFAKLQTKQTKEHNHQKHLHTFIFQTTKTHTHTRNKKIRSRSQMTICVSKCNPPPPRTTLRS